MILTVLVPLEKYLDRKTRCRLRATCKEARDTVMKPKSLRHLAIKLDISVFAKIDMVLAACKVRCVKWLDAFNEVEIYMGYQKITSTYISNVFKTSSENDVLYFLYQRYIKFDRDATDNTMFEWLFPNLIEGIKDPRNIIDYLEF